MTRNVPFFTENCFEWEILCYLQKSLMEMSISAGNLWNETNFQIILFTKKSKHLAKNKDYMKLLAVHRVLHDTTLHCTVG